MKHLLIFVLLLSGFFSVSEIQADEKRHAILVVFDDSGLVSEPAEADALKLRLLGHLQSLLKRREYANARLDVITTSLGRTRWVGDLRDLKDRERGAVLVSLIPSKPDRCNNLSKSFRALGENIRARSAEGYSNIQVLIFSSLIDTGGVCEEQVVIKLPQMPPDIDVSAELSSTDTVKRISFYWVNPHQHRVWSEKLRPLSKWASDNGVEYEFLSTEETRYAINKRKIMGARR